MTTTPDPVGERSMTLRERVLESLSECDTDRDRADDIIEIVTEDVQRRIADGVFDTMREWGYGSDLAHIAKRAVQKALP